MKTTFLDKSWKIKWFNLGVIFQLLKQNFIDMLLIMKSCTHFWCCVHTLHCVKVCKCLNFLERNVNYENVYYVTVHTTSRNVSTVQFPNRYPRARFGVKVFFWFENCPQYQYMVLNLLRYPKLEKCVIIILALSMPMR